MEIKSLSRFSKIMLFSWLMVFFANCTTASNVSNNDELDIAIREASDYLNNNLPQGNKLVILNFQSDYPDLSEYIIEELIANTVNDKVFTVVDRTNLALIQQETSFQMSGEVSDETAVSIGQKLGAQIIISGNVSKIGDLYRLRVRALDVMTAQISGQFNRNISSGRTIASLTKNNQSRIAVTSTTTNTSSPRTQSNNAVVQNTPRYNIGDIGPAGGIIFYDKGNNRGGWRYLEAAPSETERLLIMGNGIMVSSQERRVGFGKENTKSIMEYFTQNGGEVNTAAWYCDNLAINGFNDWYLPSSDELMYIYANLYSNGIGGIRGEKYWSSTYWGLGAYLYINLSRGEIDKDSSSSRYLVRSIRQF